jgi:hypothetical protein
VAEAEGAEGREVSVDRGGKKGREGRNNNMCEGYEWMNEWMMNDEEGILNLWSLSA